jgi:hypothetical protein
MVGLTLWCDFVLGKVRIWRPDTPDTAPDGKTPLSSPEIEALPEYRSVNVATVHFEYGNKGEVPEVGAELAAMQYIFQLYGFNVRDITIPVTSSEDAQSFLESQIRNLYQGLSAPNSLAIIVYGGHGDINGIWQVT